MRKLVQNVKKNSRKLLDLTPRQKEDIISDLAQTIRENFKVILEANVKDLESFNKGLALKDRLLLNENRLNALCKSLEEIAYLEDPVHKVHKGWINHAGLKIEKISIPIGLICVIYEARPALSAEIVALMLKSSNACILKGGIEAKNTNLVLFDLVCKTLKTHGLDQCFLMLYQREELLELLGFDDLIDVIIPRGSTQMIQEISKNTKIPLIKQDKGLCHIFVDESANLQNAVDIVINAKCQRVSVCNALETLLIHQNIAKEFLNLLIKELEKFKVKIHAHQNALSLFEDCGLEVLSATDEDFKQEWLDYEMSVKLVRNCDEAIAHINEFSSSHSEAILSNDAENIAKFQKYVLSACVYVNASTRFSDGGEFGFGGEVGISTSKLHARGPMGVEEICTYKYLISGGGQVRQ